MYKILFPLIGLSLLLYGCSRAPKEEEHVAVEPIPVVSSVSMTSEASSETMDVDEQADAASESSQNPQLIEEQTGNGETKDMNGSEGSASSAAQSLGMDKAEFTAMLAHQYRYEASLQDINQGFGFGLAKADLIDGTYHLLATFLNMPEPEGTDFYEGWVMRDDPFDIVSTGKIENVRNVHLNMFVSTDDLLDHTTYILTLEPDDGDPSPAKRVLEGTFEPAE